MVLTRLRSLACLLAALLAFPFPSGAFDTPLSDTAVREAYFMGQRHDLRCLEAYTKSLPVPAKGPHIAAVTFLTPFAQVVQQTSTRVENYSAQQAQADHRDVAESVQLIVLINLTPSYGPVISPGDASRPDIKPVFRPYDFWKDFSVTVFDGDQPRHLSEFHGRANFGCVRQGNCTLTGATLEFTFLAASFASDIAVVQIVPPEGDPVIVKFNLASLR
jgi:hypothetical protein